MPLSYSKGDRWCGRCHEWVRKMDIQTLTYKDKNGRLLHECGFAIRARGRQELESVREDAQRHKSPIKFSRRYHIRSDILLNRAKWEKLLKS